MILKSKNYSVSQVIVYSISRSLSLFIKSEPSGVLVSVSSVCSIFIIIFVIKHLCLSMIQLTTTEVSCLKYIEWIIVIKMMLGGTTGEVNPNSGWLNSRGMWLSYLLGVLILHIALLSIPFLTTAWAWTLTCVVHNLVSLSHLMLSRLWPQCFMLTLSTQIFSR